MPDKAVLLHIGPHKTGTTTIQYALLDATDRLARHGVLFPATVHQPRIAVRAVTGSTGVAGEPPPNPLAWKRLCAKVHQAADQRVVLSSETFTGAGPDVISRIVNDLGGERVHIAATLRPLTKILPSQWQQYLLNRRTTTYDDWLHEIFDQPDSKKASAFWLRHAHDDVIARWTKAVGADRMTVVVSDESRPRALLDAFEDLLSVPRRTLRTSDRLVNRSLTLGEAELVRLVNLEARRLGWSNRRYAQDVREAMGQRLKSCPPVKGDPRITTPAWAVQRAVERQVGIVASIRDLGVAVVGDLDALVAPPSPETVRAGPPQNSLRAMTRLTGSLALSHATLTALRTLDVDTARRLVARRRASRKEAKRKPVAAQRQ